MRRIAVILLFSLLTTGLSLAQDNTKPKPEAKPAEATKAAALPAVDQILDKYVEAIGGKTALEKLTSRVSRGSFEMPAMNASGPVEMYEKAPNKRVIIINITGFGLVQEGFDGKTAWGQDPMQGLREKSGAELASAKLDAEFYAPLKLKQLYPKMEVKGKDKVGESEVYVVVATPAEGDPEKMYFDAKTGLLLRQDSEREGPQGKMAVEFYLEDYRAVDGVKMPFVLRLSNPAFSWTLKLEEVKHNGAIEDAKFNKPAGQ